MHKNQYAGVSPLSAEVAISWTVSLGKSLMALRSPQRAVKLPDLSVRNIPCSPFLSVSLKKEEGGPRDAVQERALGCPPQKMQRFLRLAVVLVLAGVWQAEGRVRWED